MDNAINSNTLKKHINTDNIIIRWPKKRIEQNTILQYLVQKFAQDRIYSEQEVNSIIKQSIAFEDYALIRRELFERDYMNRTDDCRKYWKK